MLDDKTTGERLRSTAEGFCKAFIAKAPPSDTLDKYFIANPKILEHGPEWANERLPFLGVTFEGRRPSSKAHETSGRTCDDYYDLLTSLLSFHPAEDTLPPREEFMVDPVRKTVTIMLHARFASVRTGKSWEEDFVYVLSDFDEDFKIGSQELWADPLSAWVAVGD